jgi:hypothetical protein
MKEENKRYNNVLELIGNTPLIKLKQKAMLGKAIYK